MVLDCCSVKNHTRGSGVDIGGGDIVRGQSQIQGLNSTGPRAKAEMTSLRVKGVVGHVQQAASPHCHLLGQCHLERYL